MKGRALPPFITFVGAPNVDAHTRGTIGNNAQSRFALAGGARWTWRMEVPALRTEQALCLRAWLHSLRGASGTFRANMPGEITVVDSVAGYSDGALHSDDSDYSDHGTGAGYVSRPVDVGSAFFVTAAGADAIYVNGPPLRTGAYLQIMTDAGPQTVHVVAVDAYLATIRPRLRAQVAAGASILQGAVENVWRLSGQPPFVPLINCRSLPVTLEIEEAI